MTGIAVGITLVVSTVGGIKAQDFLFKSGGQKLMNPPSGVATPSDAKAMACPKCTTEWLARPIAGTKAMEPKTQLVPRHLCNGCETTITTVGHGKQATDVATHKCTSCGADTAACCSTAKSDVTVTKGMEQ